MAKTTSATKPARNLPALVPAVTGSEHKLAVINTKSSKGNRVLRPWEFRQSLGLSRKEAAEKYPAYYAEMSRQFNTQTAAAMQSGKLHIGSFAIGAGGNITIKAKAKLPDVEVVQETRTERKAMSEADAMKALGITPEMLAALKKSTPAPETPKQAETPAPVAPAAETQTLDQLLEQTQAEAAKTEAAAPAPAATTAA